MLRLTDHKTGRKPDRIDKVIIGGGAVLQPVLYAMTIEAALDQPVYCGRLFYCTSAGSFHPHEIPLNEQTRAAGLEVLQVVDRAIERGLPGAGADRRGVRPLRLPTGLRPGMCRRASCASRRIGSPICWR